MCLTKLSLILLLNLLTFSEMMGEPVKSEMLFVEPVEEKCVDVDVKEELVDEQDPLGLEKGSTTV